MEFRLVEFNPRRASRGAEAARLECSDEDGSGSLWMSQADIRRNMMAFGSHPELAKALAAYAANVEYRAPPPTAGDQG